MNITVAVKVPGQPAVKQTIDYGSDYGLKDFSEIVGGYLEMVPFLDEKFVLICNEEGKLTGLPANILMPGDTVRGTVIVAGRADPEIIGLSDLQFEEIADELNGMAV